MTLARSGTDPGGAVGELRVCCGGDRVLAVKAREQLLAWLDSEPDQRDAMLAIGFLDQLVEELSA